MSRFKRPDPLPQPSQQPPSLGKTAEERLPQVEMPLDEPRQYEAAGHVDNSRPRWRLGNAERENPAVADQEVGVTEDGGSGVQGENRAPAQKQGGRGINFLGLHGGFVRRGRSGNRDEECSTDDAQRRQQ